MRIPKSLIQQYHLSTVIEINPTAEGILIKPRRQSRAGWEEQLVTAIKQGHQPDEELLEGFTDEFTEQDWEW